MHIFSLSLCFSFAHLWNTCLHVNIEHTDPPEACQRVQVDGCVWLVQAVIGINCHGRRHARLSHEVNSDWPDEARSFFMRSRAPRASCTLPVPNPPHLSTLHPWRWERSGHPALGGVWRLSTRQLLSISPACLAVVFFPSAISLIVPRLLESETSLPLLFLAGFCVAWILPSHISLLLMKDAVWLSV